MIEVIGAAEHNLKNIDVTIPQNKLVVITGISGSGKSSLAFDTIYAEGQRRYMETFSNYARQFIGEMERPRVETITGLSPVISIEQKTTGKNPRSTVGTVTEVYDFLRLLYARAGEAYSYLSGKKMVRYSEDEMLGRLLDEFHGEAVTLMAPLVRGRKGHYRELFDQMRKLGFTRIRVDGELTELLPGMQVDRYKVHDIELVIDRFTIDKQKEERIQASLASALKLGEGFVMILRKEENIPVLMSKFLVCPDTGLSYEIPSPNTFSFNSPYGACPACNGLGFIHDVDIDLVIPDRNKSINDAGIVPLGEVRNNLNFKQLRAIANRFGFTFSTPVSKIPEEALHIVLYGSDDAVLIEHDFGAGESNYNLVYEGLLSMVRRMYKETSSEKVRRWAEGFMHTVACSECNGQRLRKESLHFKINGLNISEVSAFDLAQLKNWLERVPATLSPRNRLIARDILKELNFRVGFLLQVGLSYLQLDRPARTLSGGESQRIRLATQIGSQLTGITYVLDEPSIGLHQRDNERLIGALRNLSDIGNTVLVVEHDRDIMRASDYLIDLGPGAGVHGGEVVASGVPEVFEQSNSLTARYLRRELDIGIPEYRRPGNGHFLSLRGAVGNNLNSISLSLPLGTFNCITGVSGSGKSTLINETLYPILRQKFHKSLKPPLTYDSIDGLEHLDKVIEIDQSPIGRTPRSNPATYLGFFTEIRKLFSEVPEARIRGYKIGRFSFNVKGGRCETCQGAGKRVIEMNFLPDVQVDCETCMGRRYNRETLEILYKRKNIAEVLDMTVEDAAVFFEPIPKIYRQLKTLLDVGLGYITIGQSAVTLSGGEAQRIKLAEELSRKDTGSTFYILDEPTTGLHFEDIRMLLKVLQGLVSKGNTVVVIEHNLDVIKVADYIVDLGPEGGSGGGNILCSGTPEEVSNHPDSYTGRFLRKEFEEMLQIAG